MFLILWTYRVRPTEAPQFEKHYCTNGTWAAFFRNGKGYLGTQLLRDCDDQHVFATIDRWESQAAYEAFRTTHSEEYKRIDESCDKLTVSETHLGNLDIPA